MSITDVAAWWGAVLATLVLGWDVFTWLRQGPSLRFEIRPNVFYPDSEVLSKQVDAVGNTSSKLADYCHIEIANVGDTPTTITNIEATHKSGRPSDTRMTMTALGFGFHNGVKLPHKLGPGESLGVRLDMRIVAQLILKGAPIILVRASHQRKPIELKIPPPPRGA